MSSGSTRDKPHSNLNVSAIFPWGYTLPKSTDLDLLSFLVCDLFLCPAVPLVTDRFTPSWQTTSRLKDRAHVRVWHSRRGLTIALNSRMNAPIFLLDTVDCTRRDSLASRVASCTVQPTWIYFPNNSQSLVLRAAQIQNSKFLPTSVSSSEALVIEMLLLRFNIISQPPA